MFADLKLHLDKTQSLIDILQHPSGSNIRAIVQRLVLINLHGHTHCIDDFDIKDSLESQAAAAQRGALRSLGNCLSSVEPVVKHVRLCSGAQIMTLEAALFLLSGMKTSVTHLELIDFTLIDFSYALDIIYTLPQLDTLLLDQFSFGDDDHRPDWSLAEIQPERIGQGPSSLTILKCPDDSTQMVISWALTRQPVPRIDIPIMNCEASRSRGACEAWRTVWLSPLVSVRHLRIKFVEKLSIEGGVLIDPGACTNIHTLEFYDIIPHPSKETHAIAAPMLLSRITSTRVEHVVLAFKYTTFVSFWMEFFDWAGVAAKLARPEFSNLRTLTVRSGPWWQPRADAVEAETLLRQGLLSRFHNRGILEIVFDAPFLD